MGGRRRKKWSKLKTGRVFEIATKNKNFNFFFNFFGPDFFGPKIGPCNFGKIEGAPPTSRLGPSGPGGRRRKKWSKSKTGRIFEIATKNQNFNFFLVFFGADFFGPETGPRNFGRVESAPY